nr:MAG TPA: hypothetical protein [Caudoviricetes sp.]
MGHTVSYACGKLSKYSIQRNSFSYWCYAGILEKQEAPGFSHGVCHMIDEDNDSSR